MWDNTYVTRNPGHSTNNTTIHEHRAVTDDSIRIYKELLEKSQRDIVDTIELKNNTIDLAAVIFKDHLTTKTICRYRVILNGAEIEGEIKVVSYSFSNKRKVIGQILEKVAQSLAKDLVKLALNNPRDFGQNGRYELL